MVKRKTLAMLDDKYEKHETAIHDSCQDDHLDANDALNCDTDIYYLNVHYLCVPYRS